MKRLNVSDNKLAAIVAIVEFLISMMTGVVAKCFSDDAGVVAGWSFLVGFAVLILFACVLWRREAVVHICNIAALMVGVLVTYFLVS